MRSWLRKFRQGFAPNRHFHRPDCFVGVEQPEDRYVPSAGFVETPLVSDVPGFTPHTDRNLINPWGFFETSAGQFRSLGT
jgi:hypothetical protein